MRQDVPSMKTMVRIPAQAQAPFCHHKMQDASRREHPCEPRLLPGDQYPEESCRSCTDENKNAMMTRRFEHAIHPAPNTTSLPFHRNCVFVLYAAIDVREQFRSGTFILAGDAPHRHGFPDSLLEARLLCSMICSRLPARPALPMSDHGALKRNEISPADFHILINNQREFSPVRHSRVVEGNTYLVRFDSSVLPLCTRMDLQAIMFPIIGYTPS